MAKPLAGIKVIELANFIAGPLCGTLLADMGADVIKVEPPKGDMSRATPPIRNGESVSFVALNRNKRSLVLDLKRPEATEILLKLAAQSDVFVEAYRPGALEKLGLGGAQVKAVNPRIVYTSVSGFGQSGPYRRRAGVNLIIEAFSGMLSVTGEPGKMPMRPGVQTADVFGALFATYATLGGAGGHRPHRRGLRRRRVAGRDGDRGRGLGGGRLSRDRQGSAAARQPASAQRAVSTVRMQGRALSGDRHAQRPAVRKSHDGPWSASAYRAIRASCPIPAARPTKMRFWLWSNRQCANANSKGDRSGT